MPLAKNIKRYFSFKELMIVFLAIIISVSAGVGVFVCLKKEVVIYNDGTQVTVKTMKTTVKEVLAQVGIQVKPYDYISISPDTKLQRIKRNEIHIKKAVPVHVKVDGQEKVIMTYRDTVKDALESGAVKLSALDKLDGVNLGDKIVKDMEIKVIRVKEETVSEKTSIPYKVVKKENSRMDQGAEAVKKEGKEGIREKLFKVVFEDGKEVARELLKDSVISDPIEKIVEYGTILNHKTSRGEMVRYKKVLDMRATAYTASYSDTGKNPGDPGFGVTFSGMKVRKGIIAVDPRVIAIGTRVYVEIAGNTPDYGYAIAGDTGGAIKGNLIDLYFDDFKTVDRWGCKRVKVYILAD